MARPKLSKEEAIRRMCAAMLIAVDDHRLTPEQRARAERHVRNLRAMQTPPPSSMVPLPAGSAGREV